MTHQFETALKAKVIESTTASWEFWFGLLESYKEEFHDCLVTALHVTASGYKLGPWINAQRHKKDKLSLDRIQRLDALGFIWDPFTERWDQGFKELVSFKEEFGHCVVRRNHNTADGYKLGRWVEVQRSNRNRLTSERIQRLDALGFVWKIRNNPN